MTLCPHGRPLISPLSMSGALKLKISGIGPVPSKKNDKIIGKNQMGKHFILQGDESKAWMENAILVLVSELNSEYRTAAAMGTTQCPLCWIASSLPSNDSAKHIRRGAWELTDVDKGNEGAVISIERYAPKINPTEAAQFYAKTLTELKL